VAAHDLAQVRDPRRRDRPGGHSRPAPAKPSCRRAEAPREIHA
jgi:hypothetical protein